MRNYIYSLDQESHLINIKDAVKSSEYYCPCCGKRMIPRQGNIRRWHFAHKNNQADCSYETYLHKIAKIRISKCFNESAHFNIKLNSKSTCAVRDCPVGTKNHCTWITNKNFDLKQYYDRCEAEVVIDKFRADLVLSNRINNIPPILIEIYVTHKSTEEKLSSNYRIIEIHIESEDDINRIVSTATIEESCDEFDSFERISNNKIRFYNFRVDSYEIPKEDSQAYKFRFWIRSNGYFIFEKENVYYDSIKCLSPNPPEIKESIFRIESRTPIGWDFAFCKLAESGLNIKYCTMCKYYKWNDRYMRSMCILYKAKATEQFPQLQTAMNCPFFKNKNYRLEEIGYNQECRISVQ